MPSSRDRLFDELGLRDVEEPTNPLTDLFIDAAAAQELLVDDDSGETLRLVAKSIARVLARKYHPDTGENPDTDRLEEVTAAKEKIIEASPAALRRWTRQPGVRRSGESRESKEARERLTANAVNILQSSIELGSHPEHFGQLRWSQGVIGERNGNLLLLRQTQADGLQVLGGTAFGSAAMLDEGEIKFSLADVSRDVRDFFRRKDNFGLAPETPYMLYIDENGRASLLSRDLKFLMDITGPIAEIHEQRDALSNKERSDIGTKDLWARNRNPLLISSRMPGKLAGVPVTRAVQFPTAISYSNRDVAAAWVLPFSVAGSISDTGFFGKFKHNQKSGALEITASQGVEGAGMFNLLGVPTEALLSQNPGYTPLVSPKNRLVLFDDERKMPIVTDLQIVGLLGNDAYAE